MVDSSLTDLAEVARDPQLERARIEHDEQLLSKRAALADGREVEALAPFARAYLGLLFDIDKALPAEARVCQIAHAELAQAVLSGMSALLDRPELLPSCEQIGRAAGERHPLGYVVLAGMSRHVEASLPFSALSETTRASALCYALAYDTPSPWLQPLIDDHPALTRESLRSLWVAALERGSKVLPGFSMLFERGDIAGHVVLPLLEVWPDWNRKQLRQLLLSALERADPTALLALAERRLTEIVDVRRRTYWLATAFLLDPDRLGPQLPTHCGRIKEKIWPLLELLSELSPPTRERRLSGWTLAYALRVIAPAFTPQRDGYGNLCDTSTKVIGLFHQLARSPELAEPVAWLSGIRVMGPYSALLESIQGDIAVEPDLNHFVARLEREGRLAARRNWFQ